MPNYASWPSTIDCLFDAIATKNTSKFISVLGKLTIRDRNQISGARATRLKEKKSNGLSLLALACKIGTPAMVEKLLEFENIRFNAAQGENLAFRLAAGFGNVQALQMLLKIPAVYYNVTASNNAAYQNAVTYNRALVVHELLKIEAIKKIFINNISSDVLTMSARNGHLAMIQELLTYEEIKNNTSLDHYAALCAAAKNGHSLVVLELLKIDKVRERATHKKNNALNLASCDGHMPVVEALWKVEGVKNKVFDYILYGAAKRNQIEVLAFYLSAPHILSRVISNQAEVLCNIFNHLQPSAKAELFHRLKIYGVKLSKVLDIRSVTFLKNLRAFCETPADFLTPEKLKTQQAANILQTQQAVNILRTQQLVFEYQQIIKANAGKKQSPHDPKNLKAIMHHFKTIIEPYVKQTFIEAGGIIGVEAKIRTHILNRIKVAALDKKKDYEKKNPLAQLQPETEIIEFIDQHGEALKHPDDQNKELMAQARSYFNSNTEINHLAWRAYDPYAPCSNYWPNLLTEQFEIKENVFSMSEIIVTNENVSSKIASNISRHFICCTYLLVIDGKSPECLKNREENFFAQIGDIRRANNDSDVEVDTPSCMPGIIGRAFTMWRMHEHELKLDAIQEIPNLVQAKVVSTFITWLKRTKTYEKRKKLFKSLVMLFGENVHEFLDDKIEFAETLAILRQSFIEKLGTHGEWMSYLNANLVQMNYVDLITEDKSIFLYELLADIGGKWFCQALTAAYQANKAAEDKNPYHVKEKDEKYFNAPLLAGLAQKSAAWQTINPIIRANCPNQDISGVVHQVVEEWIASVQNKRCLEISKEAESELKKLGTSKNILQKIGEIFNLENHHSHSAKITPMYQKLKDQQSTIRSSVSTNVSTKLSSEKRVNLRR